MANKDLEIKKVKLDNKTRQGDYYYIRRKGRAGKYYKIKSGVPLSNYVIAYDSILRSKKTGVKGVSKRPLDKTYADKLRISENKIDKLIKKGITNVVINNMQLLRPTASHEVYKRMLRPLVDDDDVLDVLATEDNVKKFKHRIKTVIILTSSDNEVELQLKAFNKSIADINRDVRQIMTSRPVTEGDIDDLMDKGYSFNNIPRGVEIVGSKKRTIAGSIDNISLNIRFVKGV